MKTPYDVISELETTPSSNQKLEILKRNKNVPFLKSVIYMALSPKVKFYIKKIPEYKRAGYSPLDDSLQALNNLAAGIERGNVAIEYLKNILENAQPPTDELVCRIIEKDLKCGINATTVNKVWPNLIETTPYMGAISFNKKKAENLFNDKRGVLSQTKMDGRYVNAIVFSDGSSEFESRAGETTFLGSAFIDVFPETPNGFVLNGELTIPGRTRYDSNGIIASLVSINKKKAQCTSTTKDEDKFKSQYSMTVWQAEQSILLTVWDILTFNEYRQGESILPYVHRFAKLQNLANQLNSRRICVVESTVVNSLDEAFADWSNKLSQGEEGTILKGLSGTWKDGKPNWQIKVKLEFSVDLKMVGFNKGTPGTRLENTVGSLICVSDCGKVRTDPAGLTDEDRSFILENWETLLNKYVEVTCSGLSVTENGYSLLHPRFSKIRDDKNSGDTLESIKKIENGIKQLGGIQ